MSPTEESWPHHRQSRSFAARLLKWFDQHQRDLPWRQTKSLYRIWVSEIMLQQTQVATVIAYFNRFIDRFPTVETLAAADEAEVLKLWEGLGYYRRAKQLHAAAKHIVEQHQGEFPTDIESVLALPGVGRYTAGAILSIGLDQRQPILEGNTIRLYARLIGLKRDPRSGPEQKTLWRFAESILPTKRCGDFNQALMEVGNLICTPKQPACHACPLEPFCVAKQKDLQAAIPMRQSKMEYENRTEVVVLIRQTRPSEKYLVYQCLPGERWAGLWDFPRYELNTDRELSNETLEMDFSEFLTDVIKAEWGFDIAIQPTFWSLKHAVTRFRITLHLFAASKVGGKLKRTVSTEKSKPSGKAETDISRRQHENVNTINVTARALSQSCQFSWVSLDELETLPMNVTARKITRWLKTERNGAERGGK